jgi:hypothetical protein
VILVNLKDPHVHVRTVLSSNSKGVECNSTEHSGKVRTSNCSSPYPFEALWSNTERSMLGRYVQNGAVAAINTDYFGPDGDHGAEGLAVREGKRLDKPTNPNAFTRTSLAVSINKVVTIGKPKNVSEIKTNSTHYNTVAGGPTIVRGGKALGVLD